MPIDGLTTGALVLTASAVGSVAAWSWRKLVGVRSVDRALRKSFFEPLESANAWRHGPLELQARVDGGRLRVEGPLLPPGTPTFHPTSAGMAIGPARIWSGDLHFDRHVRTQHVDPDVGVAWLREDVRAAVLEAVARSAAIIDGRWVFEAPISPLLDVEEGMEAVAKASEAMGRAPVSVAGALKEIAKTDPLPGVRAHAIDVLTERGHGTERLADLVGSREPAVLLALVRSGGTLAGAAWRQLAEVGSAAERTAGAIARASHPEAVDETVLATLIDALSDEGVGDDAARALRRSGWPGVRAAIRERYAGAPPNAARALLGRLARAERRRAAGAVSVVASTGGEVSLPKEE